VNSQAPRGEVEAAVIELQKKVKKNKFSMKKVSLLMTWVMDRVHRQQICK